mmetsp:Transcript_7507/g.9664  ORF Transcript_7507/g.9664 Transcript_7507/m.9664 type:complete len:154 (+) Transcript_7507:52-513(+)
MKFRSRLDRMEMVMCTIWFCRSNSLLCFVQIIEMFTHEVAEQAGQNGDGYVYDTVLQKQKFAVFRLCPTRSCSASKNFGCDNTYGEYFRSQCLSADDVGISEQKKECYCRYCEECAAGNCQNQYNRKLDGAEEEVNYCTDSACANYLDTCEVM